MYTYNNYGSFGNYPQPQQQPLPQTNVSWIYVNGINGAREHIVQPGQTAWMMDNNDPVIHVKTVDSMGTATLKSFQLTEITPAVTQQPEPQYATKADIEMILEKITKIESMLN